MIDAPFPGTGRVLGLDDEGTAEVLDAIGPASARAVLTELEQGPATAPELADRTDLTTQNVAYHLDKLTDADLVRVEGTRGSGGNAPTVYAPTEGVVLSTRPADSGTGAPNLPVGALGLLAGVLLTVLCLHSVTDQPTTLLTLLEHELGHLLTLL
jgi:DNA-binding transcriptional ArsR family regulator